MNDYPVETTPQREFNLNHCSINTADLPPAYSSLSTIKVGREKYVLRVDRVRYAVCPGGHNEVTVWIYDINETEFRGNCLFRLGEYDGDIVITKDLVRFGLPISRAINTIRSLRTYDAFSALKKLII